MMFRKTIGVLLSALAGVWLFSTPANAAPWIEADDVYLRASIQQLADAGFLRGNVNTYPLMWSGIARDLRNIDPRWLTEEQHFAYRRVHAALQFAQQPRITGVKVQLNSDKERQQSFADVSQENAALQISRSFQNQHTAGRLRTNLRAGSADGNSYTFDGSYFTTILGNWALSFDQMPVWWGPGQDTALTMSTNARPVQAIRLNRLEDNESNLPLLKWFGYWHATGFIGRTQSSTALGDQQVAGGRLSLRPLRPVQLGFSFTTQWGGKSDEYSESAGRHNQTAAADLRVALPFNTGVYTEFANRIGESRTVDDNAWLVGIDHNMFGQFEQHYFFIEAFDIPEYFYDDKINPDGYRRWQRNMGAGQDQDVSGISIGYRYQRANGNAIRLTLRHQTFGHSNQLIAFRYQLEEQQEAQRTLVEGLYQFPVGDNLLTVGSTIYRDRIKNDSGELTLSDSLRFAVRGGWEYRF